MSMGDRAEGLACTDLVVWTPIDVSRNLILTKNVPINDMTTTIHLTKCNQQCDTSIFSGQISKDDQKAGSDDSGLINIRYINPFGQLNLFGTQGVQTSQDCPQDVPQYMDQCTKQNIPLKVK